MGGVSTEFWKKSQSWSFGYHFGKSIRRLSWKMELPSLFMKKEAPSANRAVTAEVTKVSLELLATRLPQAKEEGLGLPQSHF